MMKKSSLMVVGGAAIAFSSCMVTMPGPTQPPLPSAVIYNGTTSNLNCEAGGENGCAAGKDGKAVGTKTGTACTFAVLGLIQAGDMSLKAAAAEGKITEVQSVDISATAILGSVYAKKCLIVNGK